MAVRRRLGQLEAEVLAALAGAGIPVTTAELRSRLSGDPAHTTVNTILFRLLDKGLVDRVREGRGYRYRLVVDESRLVADRMRDQLRYSNDPPGVLSRFVATLSPAETRALREVLGGEPGSTGTDPS
ncbi:BlaI/MecI/CopY family transcriptional regulator [Actinomadura parmotrematis]|uniref:BlaI/MecI/CopY family transcriptional regulator n=1 Tax=Actinomadura parmotrematis TaxID=2864039 RepID=A0ABS7G5K7_9ACTN|nr:BlaI/MecI/CopY family transcriptional regulator [Actinomadura parmotrematis]MBW8487660.1 BlaI/MecI/CopY family transcriptional regulator [Actinomadura parmotrematis]